MADKISDEQPSRTDNTVTDTSDTSEKAMDAEKQALRSKDADAALEFLYSEGTTIMTDVDEKRLVRRVDWRIVPLMCRSSHIRWRVARSSAEKNIKYFRGMLQPPISRQDTGELCQRRKQLLGAILPASRRNLPHLLPVPQRNYHAASFETGCCHIVALSSPDLYGSTPLVL